MLSRRHQHGFGTSWVVAHDASRQQMHESRQVTGGQHQASRGVCESPCCPVLLLLGNAPERRAGFACSCTNQAGAPAAAATVAPGPAPAAGACTPRSAHVSSVTPRQALYPPRAGALRMDSLSFADLSRRRIDTGEWRLSLTEGWFAIESLTVRFGMPRSAAKEHATGEPPTCSCEH